ncbi:hypothetical protein CBW24_10285 [Pacificitalea manganoxidans]|uniref:Uncharacterized protein n=1 Tax=Pacificitalea manganoxidans TaxID=1411902 RepID=A0A291M0Q1_9RHOB|nr:hypothetical protein [Pacificitalea manganoxidans]MAQ44840.1 hypothetical protein [Actibacterium sp.]OWU71938.1 hypothetical protein ATO2_01025 [Roseovarius sp. 22II1-1F6A]ATI42358.1 hypothetical protein CBW24_10285 [Pacificitalea manganoxidans]MAQ46461.1 hypothetical protein [Actibacterium sp.]MBF54173.1 hypothetical protein [Actibacterium sp.]|tara:strand:+ start:493 stop:684 length:192 start_codon:yes stop_codon:yes gene_type:complete
MPKDFATTRREAALDAQPGADDPAPEQSTAEPVQDETQLLLWQVPDHETAAPDNALISDWASI